MPTGVVTVNRSHQKGQLYTLRFSRADEMLRVEFVGTAEILDATDEATTMGIDILSITAQATGKPERKLATNLKVRVDIEDGMHDATIVSSDTRSVEAGDLTAFEMMAGDFCQPPAEEHDVNSEWNDGEERKHTFGGLTDEDGVPMLRYLHEHRSENMDMDCEASIALGDGYTGERSKTQTLKLGKGIPPTTMKLDLAIRRL